MAFTRLAEEYCTLLRCPWTRPRSSTTAYEAVPARPARKWFASRTRFSHRNARGFPGFAARAGEATEPAASAQAARSRRRDLIGRILAPDELRPLREGPPGEASRNPLGDGQVVAAAVVARAADDLDLGRGAVDRRRGEARGGTAGALLPDRRERELRVQILSRVRWHPVYFFADFHSLPSSFHAPDTSGQTPRSARLKSRDPPQWFPRMIVRLDLFLKAR